MTVSLSLGEVEAVARSAARGAGYSWGLAAEAGRAVRGLSGAGIDGCAQLAALIEAVAPLPLHPLAPARLESVWDSPRGPLCPIRTGATLSDMARALPGDGIALTRLLVPALILPFCADTAEALGVPMTLSWRGGIVGIGPEGLPRAQGLVKLAQVTEADLFVHPGGIALPPAPREHRAHPDPDAWARLLAYAERTHAPDTAASRLSGAGSGLTDND